MEINPRWSSGKVSRIVNQESVGDYSVVELSVYGYR